MADINDKLINISNNSHDGGQILSAIITTGSTTTTNNNDNTIIVPLQSDILFGRGKGQGQYYQDGTKAYREIIEKYAYQYNTCNFKPIKDHIATTVLTLLNEKGRRFYDAKDNKFITDKRKQLHKIKQSLRDCRMLSMSMSKQSSLSNPTVPTPITTPTTTTSTSTSTSTTKLVVAGKKTSSLIGTGKGGKSTSIGNPTFPYYQKSNVLLSTCTVDDDTTASSTSNSNNDPIDNHHHYDPHQSILLIDHSFHDKATEHRRNTTSKPSANPELSLSKSTVLSIQQQQRQSRLNESIRFSNSISAIDEMNEQQQQQQPQDINHLEPFIDHRQKDTTIGNSITSEAGVVSSSNVIFESNNNNNNNNNQIESLLQSNENSISSIHIVQREFSDDTQYSNGTLLTTTTTEEYVRSSSKVMSMYSIANDKQYLEGMNHSDSIKNDTTSGIVPTTITTPFPLDCPDTVRDMLNDIGLTEDDLDSFTSLLLEDRVTDSIRQLSVGDNNNNNNNNDDDDYDTDNSYNRFDCVPMEQKQQLQQLQKQHLYRKHNTEGYISISLRKTATSNSTSSETEPVKEQQQQQQQQIENTLLDLDDIFESSVTLPIHHDDNNDDKEKEEIKVDDLLKSSFHTVADVSLSSNYNISGVSFPSQSSELKGDNDDNSNHPINSDTDNDGTSNVPQLRTVFATTKTKKYTKIKKSLVIHDDHNNNDNENYNEEEGIEVDYNPRNFYADSKKKRTRPASGTTSITSNPGVRERRIDHHPFVPSSIHEDNNNNGTHTTTSSSTKSDFDQSLLEFESIISSWSKLSLTIFFTELLMEEEELYEC